MGVLRNPYLQYFWSSYLAKVFILPQSDPMQGGSRPQARRRQTAKDKEFLQKYQDLFGFDQFRWINLSVVVKIQRLKSFLKIKAGWGKYYHLRYR